MMDYQVLSAKCLYIYYFQFELSEIIASTIYLSSFHLISSIATLRREDKGPSIESAIRISWNKIPRPIISL